MNLPDKIGPVAVTRDRNGYWTHPRFFMPEDSRDYGHPGEFEAWLTIHNLAYTWMENEAASEVVASYNAGDRCINEWLPAYPSGGGWFIGSIHDTEDGPVCVWLREKPCDGL